MVQLLFTQLHPSIMNVYCLVLGMSFTYAYDSRSNIVSETRNGSKTTYVYDGIGQLIRVNDPHENATWVYNYDRGGNITSKVKYAYTTGTLGTAVQTIPYTYDSTWKDKLTKYNGTTITYDAIGNPLNDGTWSYTWEKGRQLVKMVNDAATVTFKYDHNGLRTEKYVKQNGTETTTKYIYSGTRLVHMTQGSNWLHFFYDGSGQPAEMNFNGTVYIYVKNLQGDIVGIVDTTGRIVVEYKYDACGRPTYSNSLVDSNSSLTARYALMLTLNPFRYRGYVYDPETTFYYLKHRFYNPVLLRFLTTDHNICIDIFDNNLYMYCRNNPVISIDSDGYYWIPCTTNQNCYAFAIGHKGSLNPGDLSKDPDEPSGSCYDLTDVNSVANAIIRDLHNRNGRRLTNPGDPIAPYEAVLAVRVGKVYTYDEDTKRYVFNCYDYHVVLRDDSNIWYGITVNTNIRVMSYDIITNITGWPMIGADGSVTDNVVYDSEIVYIAFTPPTRVGIRASSGSENSKANYIH